MTIKKHIVRIGYLTVAYALLEVVERRISDFN
jgi:hypothetical protein